jgi:5-hydroxyisourate hydrolase
VAGRAGRTAEDQRDKTGQAAGRHPVSAVTTHVLDTALGQPAAGVRVRLERASGDDSAVDGAVIGRASTDRDGRVTDLGPAELEPGTYRLVFATGEYSRAQQPFFPEVTVTFTVADRDRHYHVPLLLSPFGYSTYRGS